MTLRRTNLPLESKQTLEEILGTKIYLRNAFDKNQLEIQSLVEQGVNNSQIYLSRQRLGQRLNIFEENKVFESIVELGKFLNMETPRRIECYDISHIQGKFVYGSMVTFIDGRSTPKFYRLFKCKEQNDDFANHAEVMRRRLRKGLEFESGDNTEKGWKLPDLIIVDGGKGQLSADYKVLAEMGLQDRITMVSIAKKEEEIFVVNSEDFVGRDLGSQGGLLMDGIIKFLAQRIRDEAHRFAITNNRSARLKTITKSTLDDVAGIGEVTKNKLLKVFSSPQNIINNLWDNPEMVNEVVGESIVARLKIHFGITK
jgi:excinuclease ABC subunit C